MTSTIRFLGATGTVTGLRYLIETDCARVLVDCGLFQGYKKLRERNWQPLPFDVKALGAVALTHAYMDHSGYVPELCEAGFAGKVSAAHRRAARGHRHLARGAPPATSCREGAAAILAWAALAGPLSARASSTLVRNRTRNPS